jgi:peptidoglycan/xylan/chitin deacetylase (PgdA/CDA1 family)
MNDHIVLLFHSIDDRDLLSLRDLGNIHPGLFERLMVSLKNEFDIISLREMIGCISGEREIDGRLISLTFDDGPQSYARNALPVMESFKIPSTCFLITDCIGDSEIYWRYLFNYCIHRGDEAGLGELVRRGYGVSGFDNDLISFTRSNFSFEKNKRVVAGIFETLFSEEEYREKEKGLFLSQTDVEDLKKNPLVDFGVHTRTHPVMSKLGDEEIYEEISGSIDYYRTKIKGETPMLSVPFGRLYKDYDERTVFAARDLGIETILSAYGGGNKKGQPFYNIRRIPVHEGMLSEGMDAFMRRIEDLPAPDEYRGREKRLDDKIREAGPKNGLWLRARCD